MDDVTAIQQLLNRCSEAASRRAFDEVETTYTPDGVWEIPWGKYEGWTAAQAAMLAVVGAFDYIIQVNAPGVITIDGDSATARSVIYESGKHTGRDEGLQVHGFFDDKLIRTADGWKFTYRRFELVSLRNFALLPAA